MISAGKWAWTASFLKEGNWYMAARAVSVSPIPSHRAASDLEGKVYRFTESVLSLTRKSQVAS